MKNIFLFIALFAFTCAHAQLPLTPKQRARHERRVERSRKHGSVLWDCDTVYNGGVPYCILYEVSHPGNPNYDYSVRSLSGKELIYVSYLPYMYIAPHPNPDITDLVGRYSYYFTDTRTTVSGSMQDVYQEVVKYNLIANGNAINPEGEAAFIKRYGGKRRQHEAITNPNGTTPDYTPVMRDHTAAISVTDGQIMQGDTNIGSVKVIRDSLSTSINIYLPNGTKIAIATSLRSKPQNITVIAIKDNTRSTLTSDGDDVMTVITYLINKGDL